ncbi:MAG: BBP7 family outer membrane beta-barrel protein [Gemmataceae bacterium]
MRQAVLGSMLAISATVTAGANNALAQGYPAAPPSGIIPANGVGGVIPPQFGPDPGLVPQMDPAPNGAPVYPPPGLYGAPAGDYASSENRGVAPKVWLNSEYLLWFMRSQPVRGPFVTTGARAEAGILGAPSTSILSGDGDQGYGLASGFRVTGGWWKGDDRRLGYEFSGFALEQRGIYDFFQSDTNGVPVIARPFVDATTGAQQVLAIAFPNTVSGSVLASTTTQTWGAEANMLLNLFRSCPDEASPVTISTLAGFRFLQIEENLNISSASTLLGVNSAAYGGLTVGAPATISVVDDYNALNRFYGGQIGIKADWKWSKWNFSGSLKVAAGIMNQTLDVQGTTSVNDPSRGLLATTVGGLYASPGSVGRLRNDEFAVIPEGQLKVGYNWTSWLSTYVGYNFIYTSRVIRPGQQYSTSINPAVTPASPSFGLGGTAPVTNFALTQSEFWLQGVSFGLLARY